MSETIYIKPIGKLLQEASLISESQLQVAVYDRNNYQNMRLGEILDLRGWVGQETADFFAEEWFKLLATLPPQYPLGHYLHQAALINEVQIKSILEEQKQTWMRFGSVAVLRGWLKQDTLDFFLQNLFPATADESAFIGKRTQFIQEKKELEPTVVVEPEIDEEDIPWID